MYMWCAAPRALALGAGRWWHSDGEALAHCAVSGLGSRELAQADCPGLYGGEFQQLLRLTAWRGEGWGGWGGDKMTARCFWSESDLGDRQEQRHVMGPCPCSNTKNHVFVQGCFNKDIKRAGCNRGQRRVPSTRRGITRKHVQRLKCCCTSRAQ